MTEELKEALQDAKEAAQEYIDCVNDICEDVSCYTPYASVSYDQSRDALDFLEAIVSPHIGDEISDLIEAGDEIRDFIDEHNMQPTSILLMYFENAEGHLNDKFNELLGS